MEEIEIVFNKTPYTPYQDEYEKMLYPVVRITAGFSTGSGVIIETNQETKELYVLTAAHVLGNANTVDVEFFSPSVLRSATVVITDTLKDLALLGVLCDPVAKASLAPRDYKPYLFREVWAVGCSLGLPPRPSHGFVTRVEPVHWEVSAAVLPGNSGCPVYDARTYKVIGIVVWVRVYQGQLVTTMAGVVPITEIHKFLEQVALTAP
jgi:S1-C subfamily serine protease